MPARLLILIQTSLLLLRLNTPYSKMAAILLFFCLLANYPLLPRSRENILLNVEFKSEATRANLQENKRILKWRPFWNKVYRYSCNVFTYLMTRFNARSPDLRLEKNYDVLKIGHGLLCLEFIKLFSDDIMCCTECLPGFCFLILPGQCYG